jgi:aspartyl-tRNA(Asn)/glutamyl-tRNA(Gln) amidotransferase subunit A
MRVQSRPTQVAAWPRGASALAAAAASARGETSSLQLVRTALLRLDTHSSELPVMTELHAQRALDQAVRRDAEPPRSLLHGLPVVLKDLIDVAGMSTRAGSRLYQLWPTTSAALVQRLESAGLVVLGKTRLQELAFGGWGTHAHEGSLRNPWDAQNHRVAGGSSSGSAVAVAARLAPLSVGTDTGGSVRIPASLCGLVGFKPGYDQVPMQGVLPLSLSLDSVGPLANNVADAAALYQLMAGLPVRLPQPFDWRGRVIGRWSPAALGRLQSDQADVYEQSLQRLQSKGARIRSIDFDLGAAEMAGRVAVIIGFEGWRQHGKKIAAAPECMDPAVLERFLAGAQIGDAEYRAALAQRREDQRRFQLLIAGVDALLLPTTPINALSLTEVDQSRARLARYTRLVNYLGLCAIAVPAGLSAQGLPFSLQFVLPAGAEMRALELAAAWEAISPALPLPPMAATELVA